MSEDWSEDFFSGVALDVWRKAIPPEVTEDEADFLAGVFEGGGGARLLDVPCGNGRLALPLARRGFLVTGLDTAADFVAECRAAAEREGLPVEAALGDMRAMEFQEAFDGACCMGNSFGYFGREGTRAFLAGVARALKPGAVFVLDTALAAESVLPGLDDRAWEPVGDSLLLVERRYLVAEGRVEAEYTFITGGKGGQEATRETRMASYWVYTVAEIREMLAGAGLALEGLFGDPSQRPYEVGDPQLLLTARKTARAG